jgi:hypothetical protein
MALPYLLRDELNRRLQDMNGYHGHIAEVSLSLWRGAYQLHQVTITQHGDGVPVPFFEAPRIEISLAWRHLFHGRFVGEAFLSAPVVNFVDGRNGGEDQTGSGVDWRRRLEALAPFRLTTVVVEEGVVSLHVPDSRPPITASLQDVQAQISNLGNIRAESGRPARIDASARLLDEATVELQSRFDPIGHADDFDLHLRIAGLRLVALNQLAREYAALDFESGHGHLVMELDVQDGAVSGYVKPLFQEMRVFGWESDVERAAKGPARLAWEAVVEGVTRLFRNRDARQFATRIPVSGHIEDRRYGLLPAVAGVLRNAFIEAYRANFEGLPRRREEE